MKKYLTGLMFAIILVGSMNLFAFPFTIQDDKCYQLSLSFALSNPVYIPGKDIFIHDGDKLTFLEDGKTVGMIGGNLGYMLLESPQEKCQGNKPQLKSLGK